VQVFETRLQACQQRAEDHLHVYQSRPNYVAYSVRIVGRGIHSQNHMAKLKPEIEKLCQQHQFKYFVEENEGRILVQFGKGTGHISQGEAASVWDNRPTYSAAQQQAYPGTSQQQYGGQQQEYQSEQQPYQGGGQNDMVEEVVKKAAPILFKKLLSCCTIM